MRTNRKSPRRNRRILFVNDGLDFVNILKLCLPGFETCVSKKPLKAMETARKFKPDIVFLDLIMPEAYGGFIAAQFEQAPELAKLPIVFLTAPVSQKEMVAKTLDGYDVLVKPLTKGQIIACVEKHLGTGHIGRSRRAPAFRLVKHSARMRSAQWLTFRRN